jgi:hypothetical protein
VGSALEHLGRPNKSFAIFVGAMLVPLWPLFLFGLLPLHAIYCVGVAAMVALFFMALKGYFPFDKKGQIQSDVVWTFLVLLALMPLALMIDSGVILFWYPTNSDLWGILPYAIVAGAFHRKKLALYPEDDQ